MIKAGEVKECKHEDAISLWKLHESIENAIQMCKANGKDANKVPVVVCDKSEKKAFLLYSISSHFGHDFSVSLDYFKDDQID